MESNGILYDYNKHNNPVRLRPSQLRSTLAQPWRMHTKRLLITVLSMLCRCCRRILLQ